MDQRKISMKSSNGVNILKGQVFLPTGIPKGLVQISHGMNEYLGRYDEIVKFLVGKGYGVCGYDHLGHGKSVKKREALGYFSKKNGADHVVDDVYLFNLEVRKLYPTVSFVPQYLLGHSMGSFIARLTVAKYPDAFDKVIFVGTGGPNIKVGLGLPLVRLISLFKGPKNTSKFINNLMFGKFNDRIENPKTSKDWLTRDAGVVDRYLHDPYCMFPFKNRGYRDILILNKRCNDKRWFKGYKKELPTLLVAGKEDPVGDYGKGIVAVYDSLQQNGAEVEMLLYEDCRHEVLNELNRKEVFDDILTWLEKKQEGNDEDVI